VGCGLAHTTQVIGDKMPEFEDSCNKGYLAIRKHSRLLFQLLEMSSFSAGAGTALPCLEGDAVEEVRKRLKLGCSDRDAELHMQAELNKAKEHFSTGLLDQIHNWTHANV
jgi:phosphatidylinositol kinase/protein kinase (PI-3  family)